MTKFDLSSKSSTLGLMFLLLTVCVWYSINVDFRVGISYFALSVISTFMYLGSSVLGKKLESIPLINTLTWKKDLFLGGVVGLVFVYFVFGGISFFGVPMSISGDGESTFFTPIVQTFLAIVIFAPICEEIWRENLRINLDLINPVFKGVLSMIIAALMFTFFHYAAYGRGQVGSYVFAFVYAMVGAVIAQVGGNKSLLRNIIVHMIINASVMAATYGWKLSLFG